MVETALLIFASYAGYVGMPWWYASLAGVIAAVYHSVLRFFWMRLKHDDRHDRYTVAFLLWLCASTSTIVAVFFTVIYFVAAAFR